MNREERISVAVTDRIKNRAEQIAEENGLSLAEITRRGLLRELDKLDGGDTGGS